MKLLHEIYFLLKKELSLEWREKYALYGVLLYLFGTIFIAYLSMGLRGGTLSPSTWNAVLWIIVLFASLSAIAKSFMQENKGRNIYYYTLVSPQSIILSKIIFNCLLTSLLTVIGYGFYSTILTTQMGDPVLFLLNLVLGAVSFASCFTLLSGIASKAGNNTTLMAVLGIPIIIPVLLLLMKVSKNCLDGLDASVSYDELLALGALNVMLVTLSYILFPYLWKS